MFAVVASGLPKNPRAWAFEYKWDGVRAVLYHRDDTLRLLSRNHLNITHRYPELDALRPSLTQPTILDGEIVAIDASGRPNFSLLQRRMHVASAAAAARQARQILIVYMIFDVLYLGDRLLIDEPYRRRRRLLEALELDGPNWKTPPSFVGRGATVLDSAHEVGLEGIVAKQLKSPYRPGQRSAEWLKIKIRSQQEFVIGGWTPLRGEAHATVGAILVGYYDNGTLHYAGSVGSGFTDAMRKRLEKLFNAQQRAANPFAERVPRLARFVNPVYVAQVAFAEWTPDGSLRQPVFKGLRDDKDPRSVVREG